jgi:predicted alpha/beta superfamily hydrolase
MKNKIFFFLILPILMIGSLLNMAVAQDTVRMPDHGKLDSLKSGILKEERLIQVFVPPNYKPGSTDKYDVLYVLDGGNWNTGMINMIQHVIEGEGFMPPTIVVSVLNVDRDRDLTPTHVADNKTSGGADKFLGFLKNELIPYIDKTYPTDGDNTLWGHSFGGLFVMYTLLNEPKVFKSYIAIDPSFWWDKLYLPKMAASKLPGLAGSTITLFMSGRDEEGFKDMKIDTMDTILKKYAPADLIWKIEGYPGETHGSVRLKSTYDGLRFTYAGYQAKGPVFHPMNGTLLKDKPINIWLFWGDTTKVRYTTDGTVPTLASAKMGSEITLSRPGKLIAKQFLNREKYDNTATGEFKEGSYLPAVSKVKNAKPGGFHYNYYEGKWDKLPDFKKLKPVQSGLTDKNFDINKLPAKDNFALLIEGWLQIKEEGYYLFGLNSDDGSRLYINNKLLIDYDGLHGSDAGRSYILPLQKGFYPIRMEYFQKDGGRTLELIYFTPSIFKTKTPIPIPFELQYSN